jgi:hypothetical protein
MQWTLLSLKPRTSTRLRCPCCLCAAHACRCSICSTFSWHQLQGPDARGVPPAAARRSAATTQADLLRLPLERRQVLLQLRRARRLHPLPRHAAELVHQAVQLHQLRAICCMCCAPRLLLPLQHLEAGQQTLSVPTAAGRYRPMPLHQPHHPCQTRAPRLQLQGWRAIQAAAQACVSVCTRKVCTTDQLTQESFQPG